jgi:hypothetical protein
MPSHDRLAYSDTRCYGMTREVVGRSRPTIGKSLTSQELDDVAAYIVTNLKGRGPVTAGECQAYFGAAAQICVYYPK